MTINFKTEWHEKDRGKIELTGLDNWDIDWNDSRETFIHLSEIRADIRSAISERLGIDRENIEIDINAVDE